VGAKQVDGGRKYQKAKIAEKIPDWGKERRTGPKKTTPGNAPTKCEKDRPRKSKKEQKGGNYQRGGRVLGKTSGVNFTTYTGPLTLKTLPGVGMRPVKTKGAFQTRKEISPKQANVKFGRPLLETEKKPFP